jgi:signal transduction histidine kinase
MDSAALLELARSLHDASTLAEAMDRVVDAISAATRYCRAWLALPIASGGLEIVGYALADKKQVAARMAAVDVARDAYLTYALSARDPFVIPDLRLEPRADQEQVEFFGNRTMITVPMLRLGGERIGAFSVGTFAAEGVMVPTNDEYEFVVQVAAVVSSAAARIRAEEAQRRLSEEMQAAQRLEALGRLAGEVAHDFNNLLTVISVNAEVLKGTKDPDELGHGLDEILAASGRAAALTRQLLAFSRGQPRQVKPLALDELERLRALAVAPAARERHPGRHAGGRRQRDGGRRAARAGGHEPGHQCARRSDWGWADHAVDAHRPGVVRRGGRATGGARRLRLGAGDERRHSRAGVRALLQHQAAWRRNRLGPCRGRQRRPAARGPGRGRGRSRRRYHVRGAPAALRRGRRRRPTLTRCASVAAVCGGPRARRRRRPPGARAGRASAVERRPSGDRGQRCRVRARSARAPGIGRARRQRHRAARARRGVVRAAAGR